MLLTISTTHEPATDLGFLLHKNPGRVHTTDISFGTVHVVFSEANDERCTAAVVVEVDPVGLVRDPKGPKGHDLSLDQYVNDRPYAASSFLSVPAQLASRRPASRTAMPHGRDLYGILYQRSGNLFVLLHMIEKRTGAKARFVDFREPMDAQPPRKPRPAGHDAP